ncbi:MAG: peptidylprolyl isomerase [Burkholderiaceae bacterium]|nr:peptidylprolyl isomerase [Burkholderiaceae bacterium]
MDEQVCSNRWVRVRYRLFDAQGEAIETGQREWTYLHGGYGSVFPAVERVLEGAQAGESRSARLEPIDAFGEYDASLVRLAPRARFPSALERGMSFEGVPGEADDGRIHIVTDFTDETVVLDANHPLAGMALRFDLQVLEVREATPEEIGDEQRRAQEADEEGREEP